MLYEYIREDDGILPAVDYTKTIKKVKRKKIEEPNYDIMFWETWGISTTIVLLLLLVTWFCECLGL